MSVNDIENGQRARAISNRRLAHSVTEVIGIKLWTTARL